MEQAKRPFKFPTGTCELRKPHITLGLANYVFFLS